MTHSDKRKPRRADPPYMKWQSGQPRWTPGPHLRREGWRSIPLKNDEGDYLPRGLARVMAREINKDLERWRTGDAPKRFAPDGTIKTAISSGHGNRTLNNAWEHFRQHRAYRRRAKATQADYAKDIRRFLEWTGDEQPKDVTRADLTGWFEASWDRIYAIRAMGWSEDEFDAAPRTKDANGAAYVVKVREARWAALGEARNSEGNVPGQAQMNAVIRAVSRLYTHIWKELTWTSKEFNPASKFGLIGLKPRLRLPTEAELNALVECADSEDMGKPAVGDVLVYMANMGPRQADAIKMPITMLDKGIIKVRTQKTGKVIEVPLTKAFRRRLIHMRGRRARLQRNGITLAPNAFLTDIKHRPFTVNHLQSEFSMVRAKVAEIMPSVMDITLYDFRTMAVTRLHAASNDRDAIASITAHTYKTVDDILDHYIVPTAEVARGAIDKLDADMEARGVKW